MTRNQISEIAEQIKNAMGGDAENICNGDCPIFAMRLVDAVGKGVIVNNLTNIDDINPEYEVTTTDVLPKPSRGNRYETSHCWVEIDGIYYDAFDTYGVSKERDLQFVQKFGNE